MAATLGSRTTFGVLISGSLALAVVSVALTARELMRRVHALGHKVEALRAAHAKETSRTRELTSRAADGAERTSREGRALRAELTRALGGLSLRDLRDTLEQMPYEAAELNTLHAELVETPGAVPAIGSPSVAPSTVLAAVDELRRAPSKTSIVECGSGGSTVWLAYAVARGGEGHVHVLEHEPAFAARTREHLRQHSLEKYATVHDAPLRHVEVDSESATWYDTSGLELPASIDLLVVGGPAPSVTADGRLPAFPVLADRLGVGARIILDDAGSLSSDSLARNWQTVVRDGHLLRRVFSQGRTVVFEVVEVG
ncbi:class I SAM-dependent methyltransferase [Mumia sp. zg.B17]|uniref:class I SAM-dependent methyltransferase n=1 Tax=Mumia sp. zg.B17 TaxID=2855446 RepID=UPI001C6E0451|nr:class I SAM-dependent methyltransferase [Mumia sp. zg.B17]MBW9204512.1 class I SAM-dependent methyltransferase [Mumia sp. zg.B17]